MRKSHLLLLFLGVVYAVLLMADWGWRFSWYQWQKVLVYHPVVQGTAGPYVKNLHQEYDGFYGGNLAHMLNIPSLFENYALYREGGVEISDEFGYRNRPPVTNTEYEIVVTGDSFMDYGYPLTNMLAERLSSLSGLPVYNHSYKGRGPFQGAVKLFQNQYLLRQSPKILIFGMVEADIAGGFYVSLLSRIQQSPIRDEAESSHINWQALIPTRLSKSLPNTSIIAQVARKIWNALRYYVFGKITPDVIVADGKVGENGMLFYRYNIEAMKWPERIRNIPQVVWVLQEFEEICRERGMQLVVLLIPDKEQVYRDLIPERFNAPDDPIPPSCLWELENGLKTSGIPCVNMLQPFRKKAAEGTLLYWPDDIHWNADAIGMAAERLWQEIEPMPVNTTDDRMN
jgi:hypothetical protein